MVGGAQLDGTIGDIGVTWRRGLFETSDIKPPEPSPTLNASWPSGSSQRPKALPSVDHCVTSAWAAPRGGRVGMRHSWILKSPTPRSDCVLRMIPYEPV